MQVSTRPNKAFWEAITLVGVLLAVLLLSVLHLKGWLGRSGRSADTDPLPSDPTAYDRDAVNTPVTGGTVDTPINSPAAEDQHDRSDRGRRGRDGDREDPGGGGGGDQGGGSGGPPGPEGGAGATATDAQTLRFDTATGRFHNFPDLQDKHIEVTMEELASGPERVPVGGRGSLPGTPITGTGWPSGQSPTTFQRTESGPTGASSILRGIPSSAPPGKSTFDFVPWQRSGKSKVAFGPKPVLVSPVGRTAATEELVSPITQRTKDGQKVSYPIELHGDIMLTSRLRSLYHHSAGLHRYLRKRRSRLVSRYAERQTG